MHVFWCNRGDVECNRKLRPSGSLDETSLVGPASLHSTEYTYKVHNLYVKRKKKEKKKCNIDRSNEQDSVPIPRITNLDPARMGMYHLYR